MLFQYSIFLFCKITDTKKGKKKKGIRSLQEALKLREHL